MRKVALSLATVIAAASPLAAVAEDQQDRYVLEKSGEGFIRMDRQTGAMSYCTPATDGLACKPAVDAQADYRAEIGKLQEALAALDRRMVKLESSLSQRLESKLPTDEDFEKTLSYMERFLRSFMGVVKDLEKEPAPPPAADPDKT